MNNERLLLVMAVIFAAVILGACALQNERNQETLTIVEQVDLVEFELVRSSLYDCAMDICTGLAECDGGCFYNDVDEEYVEIFKTYRVPSLEVLLTILDQIDDHGSIWDVYDDDEGTVYNYYTYRERYEMYF